MKISTLLDGLDGYGIIWTDLDLTSEFLEKLNLSHDTIILPVSYTELNIIRNALHAFQDLAKDSEDEYMECLAENAEDILEKAESIGEW